MKRFLLSATSVLALCSAVSAADILEPVVPVEPVPVVEEVAPLWTGAWIGVEAGLIFDVEDDDDDDDDDFDDAPFGDDLFDDDDDDFDDDDDDDDDTNWSVGVAAGADWQVGSFVVGVLGDIHWTDIDGGDDVTRRRIGVEADAEGFENEFIDATAGFFEEAVAELNCVGNEGGWPTFGECLFDLIEEGENGDKILDLTGPAGELAVFDFEDLIALAAIGDINDVVNDPSIVVRLVPPPGEDEVIGPITFGDLFPEECADPPEGFGDAEEVCANVLVDEVVIEGGSIFETRTLSEELDWYGTGRVRAGIAFGRALIYATGGLAFGSIETEAEVTRVYDENAADLLFGEQDLEPFDFEDFLTPLDGGIDAILETPELAEAVAAQLEDAFEFDAGDPVPSGCRATADEQVVCQRRFEDDDDTRVGFALGAGVEFLATDNFSIGAEYFYVNLGDGDFDLDDDDDDFEFADFDGDFDVDGDDDNDDDDDDDNDFDFHTVKLRAAFRFGGLFD